MKSEVFFDVETQKLFSDIQSDNPAQLGISIVSVFSRQVDDRMQILKQSMQSFWEHELKRMWQIFEHADRIIGFNTLSFDIPALSPYAPSSFNSLSHFDIFHIVKNLTGRKLGLSALARDTLGIEKTDIGTNAVMYWNRKDTESLDKLKRYCEADVYLTRDLYDYGYNHGYLKYTNKWNSIQTVPVDFSYKEDFQPQNDSQMGLF